MDVVLRPAVVADASFLWAMLAAAVAWRPGQEPPPVDDLRAVPELAHYVAGWPRAGDRGVVAQAKAGQPVGAAWLRLFAPDDPGYGFVEAAVPELSVGVLAEWRGHGVGTRLLQSLLVEARTQGLPAVSLSVEPDNPARRLYERFGFAVVGGVGGSLTMLRRFGTPASEPDAAASGK